MGHPHSPPNEIFSNNVSLESRKAFGLPTLIALIVGNMVGAGVFTSSGFALANLRTPALVIAAWAVAGAIALCGAVAYGVLARHLRESGGEYLFLSRLMHPAIGFLAGWVSLLAGFTGAIAFAAVTMEAYLFPESSRPDWLGTGWVATAVILGSALLHALHKRKGAVSQNIAVSVKLGLLLVFLSFAFYQGAKGVWLGGGPVAITEDTPSGWPAWMRFAESLMWISLSYAGFNAAVYVAGESKEAAQTTPKALWMATLGVTILYVLLNVVFVYAPEPNQIAGQPDLAAIVANVLGGDALATFVRFTIALALLTSVSAMVVAGPRVYAQMADDGLFPKWLRFKGAAPAAAIGLQALLAIVIVWIASLREMLSYLGFTLSLTSALAVASVFLLKRRSGEHVSVPVLTAAAFYILGSVIAAVMGAILNPWEGVAGVATMVSGLIIYRFARRAISFDRPGDLGTG